MGHIHFISTTTVQPSSQIDQSIGRIELTPCDLQLIVVDYIQRGILFHKPQSDYTKDPNKSLIEHLKASFSRSLDIFYPLAGRLAITENDQDNTTSFSVDCNGVGAEFVHAAADGVTVADVLDPILVPDDIVYSFFLLNDVLNYQGTSTPLLAVQITELADGIFIGLSMNHSVVDGTSFWNFFNSWSEISRCGKTSQPVPIFGRQFLDGIIDLPVRIPHFWDQIPAGKSSSSLPPVLLQQRVFHFSKGKIAEIKAKENSEMGTNKISSLQALLGHLWLCIARTECLCSSSDQETKYKVLIGMRQRLKPPLLDQYLGNTVLFGVVKSTIGNLVEQGLGWAAWEMNRMVASQTEQEVKKFLGDWMESPQLIRVHGVTNRILLTGSSPRFNVYGNDFGWGKPVAVRSSAGNKYDGKLTVFPGAEEGSIEFEACLTCETLQALADDAEFMKSVTK
ncbi:putative shikimate O-hydroxycinnamoyltransferase [Rosa chinensis]|uniref:Putative shikimate O-hydroxycinnamoyltransferase n=1 Tax=Rosa chinensis TaxID=74649 RepID=A0A2P6RNQ2_ROSCH|nr:uncharacterized acetyltransferase At3g50280 [Rosa chinensis]PRQ48021.1 putative shikimate O-hydroxycinnamoyltransferase [Rosa chinensis]